VSDAVAAHVVYTGRVQGVGFRYRAVEIAREFPVAGWVKNLPTGQVELWAEGNENGVNGFLAAVRDNWGSFIREERVDWVPASGHYASFDVTH
jgi:acylphosphatase